MPSGSFVYDVDVQPVLISADLNRGFDNGDPRRVGGLFSNTINPLKYRLMETSDAELLKDGSCLTKRDT